MSSDFRKTHAVPSKTSTRSINPPKRFLDFPAQTSPTKKLTPVSLSCQGSPIKLKESGKEFSTPPKLIPIPQNIVSALIIPVDASHVTEKPKEFAGCNTLPPPPPLVRMPISTRKEKRSLATVLGTEESVDIKDERKSPEPQKKRTRGGAIKISESTSTPSTPRKIIQEIFGPDKSKRSKGKGRKRKRGPTSPKKKTTNRVAAEEDKLDAANEEEEIAEEDSLDLEETESKAVEEEDEGNIVDHNDDSKQILQDTDETVEQEACLEKNESDDLLEPSEVTEQTLTSNENENVEKDDEEEEPTCTSQLFTENEAEDKCCEEDEKESVKAETKENDDHANNDIAEHVASKSDSDSSLPFFWRIGRRKAKQVAKEKLKRLSQSEDGTEGETNNEDDNDDEKRENEDPADSKNPKEEKAEAAEIKSRRSTTEGSSKSGSSTAPGDSESSVGCSTGNYSNKHLVLDRQRLNQTPLSLISEDDFNFGKEHNDGKEFQEQKDSDVDSTYSWKPVRAAAAAALEQVTKNQGSGSTAGDTETKAVAVAERRARKVMRHKGRSRRTLLFKSSHSKQFTTGRHNRYAPQPIIASVVYDHGSYFQKGDIVNVELADGSFMYGQIKGILLDHWGEMSTGIRWISPKHPLYGQVDFHPRNYYIRHDLPERLIKIQYVNFIMHCNLDYFDGHPSYTMIEKGAVFTRLGKPLYKKPNFRHESDSDSDSDDERKNSSSSNGSQDNTNGTNTTGKKNQGENDNDNTSNCSTDMDELSEDETSERKYPDKKPQSPLPHEVLEDSIDSMKEEDEVTKEKESEQQLKEGENQTLQDLVCDEILDDEIEDDVNVSNNAQQEQASSEVMSNLNNNEK